MTDVDKAQAERIMKLLAKAEAVGTTPEEREALSAKASELMIKYGIDEAIARASQTGTVRAERIIRRDLYFAVPKAYSYEYATIAYRVAEVFGAKPYMMKTATTGVAIVGFESDVAMIEQLAKSLVQQCSLNLGPWFASVQHHLIGGTDRYRARRGFISGFSNGVGDKLAAIHKQSVAEAGHGAEVALVDRARTVQEWAAAAIQGSKDRGRSYSAGAAGAGFAFGQRADVGQTTVNTNGSSRREIGGR